MAPLAAYAGDMMPCHGMGQHAEATAPAEAPKVMNLKEAAAATGMLAKMTEVTKLAGLDGPVDIGPLTLLAPSDEAFNALPQDIRDRLLAPENRAILADMLLHHAFMGLFPTERLLGAKVRNYTIEAIGGTEVEIFKNRKTGEILIDGAKILRSDVTASDGIIHVIDKVLIPPAVMTALMAQPTAEPALVAEGDN
jgi:uncharacterized surface protein with fasciclin (FAS1) repeats